VRTGRETAGSRRAFHRVDRGDRHSWRFYDSGLPISDLNLKTRLDRVEERIQAAVKRAGRDRSQITLVAVTKKFSAARIREGYQCGLRDFGENYVQEFAAKRPELQDLSDARFHLIGHLQSNKVNQAIQIFDLIETVDAVKLLDRLDRALEGAGRRMNVLLEVKLSDEPSKTGTGPEQLPALLEAAARSNHVEVTGLMTVPPWSEDAESSRSYFRTLSRLASQYSLPQLSMGMSNDFEVAIEEGATIVRVGTALFGARPKPAGTDQ
jgi:pyridoxal phosphate enzyme (YggS family)